MTIEALLYEHADGRQAVALSAEHATFAHGDPEWHRVGPITLYDDGTEVEANCTQELKGEFACPICNGIEGCDPTVPERASAASGHTLTDDVRAFLTECSGFHGKMVRGNWLALEAWRLLDAYDGATASDKESA